MERIDAVLDYWLGDIGADGAAIDQTRQKIWFNASGETDRDIRDCFGQDLRWAIDGELAGWERSPRGRLALIILLDQFTRNCFRGSPDAFASDGNAQRLVLQGLAMGHDLNLRPTERLFFYMPLMHAEDRAPQSEAVAQFEKLAADCDGALKETVEAFRDSALQHKEVIERFGRFPRRNALLGRSSTPEEKAYIAAGGHF